jgi:hypothetical protein
MQQIKIFKSLEFDFEEMEHKINVWLAQSGARVLSITGNIAPQGEAPSSSGEGGGMAGVTQSDVILFVLYEKP